MDSQRVRITKKMLKDSLVQLLKAKPLHQLSVKEICETAEINRTTFYKYYGSQYELFEEMEQDVLAQIGSYLDNGIDLDINMAQLTLTLTFIHENIAFCRLLLNNNIDPQFPRKLVMALQNIPHLGNHSDEEATYLFDFMIGGGFALIKRWINKENRESPQEMAALLNATIVKVLG